MSSGFDRLARPYRWMEYLTFGPALQRCRVRFLEEMRHSHRALALGDGDGRFCVQLLMANPAVFVDAVDSSAGMLLQMRSRCQRAGVAQRLTRHHMDASRMLPGGAYDLIVTHFFLDCLSTAQVADLIRRAAPGLTPGGLWIVSEFAVPRGPLRLPAAALIRSLYLAFRILTGLRVARLPEHVRCFEECGFRLEMRTTSLGGMLVSEVWRARPLPEAALAKTFSDGAHPSR